MRGLLSWRAFLLVVASAVLLSGLTGQQEARAGGPLIIGGGGSAGGFGPDAQPFAWDTTSPVQYRTDGGMLGTLTNQQANDRVAAMFQVWQDVPTATISYTRAGAITGVADGDVSTMAEFDTVDSSCNNGTQSPIVYDADGSLFDDLVNDPNVIGFAGPCRLSVSGGIVSGQAVLNGRFIDGRDNPTNREISLAAFDATFIHEFGHFSGLDHSQINLNCLNSGCADNSPDALGLPTMFPILISSLDEGPGVPAQSTLAADDIAWISALYPAAGFSTDFGTIEGRIFFSDGVTQAQGVNVIARSTTDPRQTAVSVVSGYLFTGQPGQSLTGTSPRSPFGSGETSLIGFYRIPGLPPGDYTIEVESIDESFDAGSGVGPLNPPIPSPGPNEFHSSPEDANDGGFAAAVVSVSAGGTVSNINIILNGTEPRFDQFETSDVPMARLWPPSGRRVLIARRVPEPRTE